MSDLLDLNEAAALLGMKAPSLRKRLNSPGPDRIHGVKVKQGDREVWRVSRATVDSLLTAGKSSDGAALEYDALVRQWEQEQLSGYHTGKALSHRSVFINLWGLKDFWRFLGQSPSIAGVTPDNLRRALSSVPVDYQKRNCHFTQRDHCYKGVVSFAKMLVRIGLRSVSDLAEMRTLKPRRIFPPRRTSLKPETLGALLESIQPVGRRSEFDIQLSKTAFLLMALSGLRRQEAIRLELGHLDLTRGELRVVDGKGHKDRLVGMPPELVAQLQAWIEHFRPVSASPNVLLMADGRPMTVSAIQQRIARLRRATGIDITLHGLRRTCATLMVDSGVPLVHVQRNLGHRQISTTMQYVQTDQQTAAESFKRFSLGSLSEIPTNSTAPPPTDGPVKPDAVLGFVKAKRGKK